ncbi:hypothetical protein HMPREF9979_12185 [Staphylococcus epidermidis NIHLM018]|nr:hypothetical protein HMPREF9979_12185 [Staphylococcus epidermidis NIHLM018]
MRVTQTVKVIRKVSRQAQAFQIHKRVNVSKCININERE